MGSGPDDRSPYRQLGVADGATHEQVRIAYLRLARALHPDRLVDATDAERTLAERRMREVNEAYDAIRRGDAVRADPPPSAAPRTAPSTAPSTPPSAEPAEPDEPDVAPWDDDDVELGAVTAFLLRRGPLLAILAVAALLFFGSVLADQRSGPPPTGPTTTCASPPPTAVAGGATFTLPW